MNRVLVPGRKLTKAQFGALLKATRAGRKVVRTDRRTRWNWESGNTLPNSRDVLEVHLTEMGVSPPLVFRWLRALDDARAAAAETDPETSAPPLDEEVASVAAQLVDTHRHLEEPATPPAAAVPDSARQGLANPLGPVDEVEDGSSIASRPGEASPQQGAGPVDEVEDGSSIASRPGEASPQQGAGPVDEVEDGSSIASRPGEASPQQGAGPVDEVEDGSSIATPNGSRTASSGPSHAGGRRWLQSRWTPAAAVLALLLVGVIVVVSVSRGQSTVLAAPETTPPAKSTPSPVASTPTGSTAAAPSNPSLSVRILEPHREKVNSSRFLAHGTATLPRGTKLWLMVQPSDGAYYVTNNVEPVRVDGNRTWSGEVGLGEAKNSYDIHAVVTRTGSSFEATVQAAVQDSEKTGTPLYTVRFDPLPAGATRAASVRVHLT